MSSQRLKLRKEQVRPDSIPNFYIKLTVPIIAKPLTFLFSSSLFHGVLPEIGSMHGCLLFSRMVLPRSYICVAFPLASF